MSLMRGRSLAALAAALALTATFAVPAALADSQVVANSSSAFSTPAVTIDQGQKVTFQNLDLRAKHNVTSTAKGDDGKPLFSSDTIGTGAVAPVEGTQYLTTGSYGFLCSIHPNMTGTVTVTAAGTPVPRPGSGPSPPPPSGGPGAPPPPGGTPGGKKKGKRCSKRHGKRAKRCSRPRKRKAR